MEESKSLPKHAWLRVYLPGEGVLLAFTYMDRAAGWAARGVLVPGEDTAEPSGDELYRVLEHPDRVFRLPAEDGVRVEPLSEAETARLGLPPEPEWLAFFEAPEGALVAATPPPAPAPEPAPLVEVKAELTASEAPVEALPETPALPPAAAPGRPAPPWRNADGFAGRFHAQHEDDIEALFFFPSNGRAERMWVRLSGQDADGHGFVGTLLNTPSSPSELAEGSQVTVRA